MKTSVDAFYVNPAEDDWYREDVLGEIPVEIYRHQVGDRMASDFYCFFRPIVMLDDGSVQRLSFGIPFRQLKAHVERMAEAGLWE